MGWERESQLSLWVWTLEGKSYSRGRAIRKSIWTAQVELAGLKRKEDKKFGRQGGRVVLGEAGEGVEYDKKYIVRNSQRIIDHYLN